MFFLREPSEEPSCTLSFLTLRIGVTGLSHPALLCGLACAAWLRGEDLREHDDPGFSWLPTGTRGLG